jgi:tRNA threonylcarbamoyl adenosine modification protein YeaZ
VLILAWDTAAAAASLALAAVEPEAAPKILAERLGDGQSSHSALLGPMAAEVLAEMGVRPKELDLVACGRGPGSFTGVRVGLALAKGLGLGSNVPVMGLGSLSVLAAAAAYDADKPVLVAPLIDARHQEVFTALYRAEPQSFSGLGGLPGLPTEVSPVAAVRPQSLAVFLEDLSQGAGAVVLTGPGLSLVPEIRPPFVRGPEGPPRAAVLALLAAGLWTIPQGLAEHPPEPIYGRSPEIFKTRSPPSRLSV